MLTMQSGADNNNNKPADEEQHLHHGSGSELKRRLSQEEIEDIEEAGEVSPPSSSLFNQTLLIIAFAVLGTYVRIVLIAGTPQGYVSYLSSQFVGSFVIGFLFQLKMWIHVDPFVGISTGFCGSLTTFSTWQVSITQILVGVPGSPGSAGGKAYAWFQDQCIGFAVPFTGLTFGKHVADSLIEHDIPNKLAKWQPEKNSRPKIVLVLSIISAMVCLVGIVLGAIFVPGTTTFSLLFAPVGALTRFVLSRYLNTLTPDFYWGTFAANVGGSIVAAVIFDIMVAFSTGSLSCSALWAVQYGFCGALTTVSTFVNELHTLPFTKSAYLYGFGSVLLTQACLIIIMGAYVWSQPEPFVDSSACFFSS